MAKKPVPLDNLDGDRDGAAGGTLPDGYRWATDEELELLDLPADEQAILDAEGHYLAETAEELRTLLTQALGNTPVTEPEATPDAGAFEQDMAVPEPSGRASGLDVVATLTEIHANATDPAVREALADLVAQTTPDDLTDQMRELAWATTDPDARIQLLAQADRLDAPHAE